MKHAPALLAPLFFILPLCAQEVNLQDSLWQKAVALSTANEDWVPGLLVVRMEMLDGRGSAQSTEETWLKMSLGPDGKIKKDLIKQVKDGKVKDGPETQVEARSGEGKRRAGERKPPSRSAATTLSPPRSRGTFRRSARTNRKRSSVNPARATNSSSPRKKKNVERDGLAGGPDRDPARNPVYRPSAPGPRPAPLDPGAL